jgi:hypothetical protein
MLGMTIAVHDFRPLCSAIGRWEVKISKANGVAQFVQGRPSNIYYYILRRSNINPILVSSIPLCGPAIAYVKDYIALSNQPFIAIESDPIIIISYELSWSINRPIMEGNSH